MNPANDVVPTVNSYAHIEKSLPDDYKALLNPKETQRALWKLKRFMEQRLCEKLNLIRVETPLVIESNTGMTETVDRASPREPIRFRLLNNNVDPMNVEITQASTKWKRWALKQFDCQIDEGVLTDMRAVRQDEFMTNYHSSYVDQWDWERVMSIEQRNLDYLKSTVKDIWDVLKDAYNFIVEEYPILGADKYTPIPEEIIFVHAEELLEMFPNMTPDQRETEILKKYPAVFLIGIGKDLNDGQPHGTRTADYDDWITPTVQKNGSQMYGLNGDILVWNSVTRQRHELSSMAIRVTKDSLRQQLDYTNNLDFIKSPYSQMILNDEIPLSVGGGIGQSRTHMYLLRKAALGECSVMASPRTLQDICAKKNIYLLK